MTIRDRIILIRKIQEPKLNQTEFGKKMGMSRGMINNLELGRVEPSESVIKLICLTYDVNWCWLKDGEGDMKNPPDTAEEKVDRIMAGQDSFKKHVMEKIAEFSDEEWLVLKKLAAIISKESE